MDFHSTWLSTISLAQSSINSLWPSDAIWWHKSGSTLAQVMAKCRPSHCLKQCWHIINMFMWHSPNANFTGSVHDINLRRVLKNTLVKLCSQLPGANELTPEKEPWVSFAEMGMKNVLTHWGRVTHMCVSKLTIIGSDNGLTPGRRQAIIWINAGILLIGPLGTNFSEILIEI